MNLEIIRKNIINKHHNDVGVSKFKHYLSKQFRDRFLVIHIWFASRKRLLKWLLVVWVAETKYATAHLMINSFLIKY